MRKSIVATGMIGLFVIIAILILYVLILFFINRSQNPIETYSPAVIKNTTTLPTNSETLTLLTWNIGYGGMGKDSDFLFDRGTQLRPPSKQSVQRNLDGITTFLKSEEAQLLLLQEVPHASWNTYNIDLYAHLKKTFDQYQWSYSDDLYTKGLPSFLSIRIGNATASTIEITDTSAIALKREPGYFLYAFKKDYRMHVTHLVHAGVTWSIINVHLSAFDDEKDAIRETQLKEVISFAKEERAKGYHVVVGGDWNLQLAETDFGPYTTSEEDLFWIRPLPSFAQEEGWQWVTDPSSPTVRTAEKPYIEGENYTLVIDGFLISDNIKMLEVTTHNLSFDVTDHHPVSIILKPRSY